MIKKIFLTFLFLFVSSSVYAQNGNKLAVAACQQWMFASFERMEASVASTPPDRNAYLLPVTSCVPGTGINSNRAYFRAEIRGQYPGCDDCILGAEPNSFPPSSPITFPNGVTGGGTSIYNGTQHRVFTQNIPDPEPEPEPDPCENLPELTNIKAPTPSGTGYVCVGQCRYNVFLNPPPGPLYISSPTGAVCEPNDLPPVDVNPDPQQPELPPEEPYEPVDPGPHDPGPNPNPNDPNSPPGTGEGSGDRDGDGTSAGGGLTCNAPPTCSGAPVECAVLYQTWKNRCETVEVGERYIEQSEAIRKDLNTALQMPGGGDPWGWTGIDQLGSNRSSTITYSMDNLDQSGFISNRQCPVFPNITFSMFGNPIVINFSDFNDAICTVLRFLGIITLMFGAFTSFQILGGKK